MKVLFVLTSHDKLGDTGKKTGFWVEEFASPYYSLLDQGVKITVATPKGGAAPIETLVATVLMQRLRILSDLIKMPKRKR